MGGVLQSGYFSKVYWDQEKVFTIAMYSIHRHVTTIAAGIPSKVMCTVMAAA